MRKLLMVEDEAIVRLGLRHLVRWEEFGIRWEAEASNGREAIAILESGPIDVVVTDIRMPEMDGIELVKWIKERNLDVQIVVVSSYNDFAYVQEALRLGVADYLHKPTMTKEEIEAALRRIVARLDQAKRAAPLEDVSPPESLQALLASLPEGGEPFGHRGSAAAALAAAPFQDGYRLVLLRLANEQADEAIRSSIRSLLNGFALRLKGTVTASPANGTFAWLMPAGRDGEDHELDRVLTEARRSIANLLQATLQYGASDVYRSAEELLVAYEEAAARTAETAAGYHQSVRMAKEYVDRHFRSDLTLAECARHVHVSPGHLSRLFPKELGMSFSDYVTRKRLEHASVLLRSTNKKVHQISEEAGYQNPHYFSKQFKEAFGVTPREYRN